MAAVMGSATTARHFTAQRQDLGHWRLLQLDGKRVPLCEDRQTSSSDQPGGAVRSAGSLGGNRGDGSSGRANGVVLLQKQQRATAADAQQSNRFTDMSAASFKSVRACLSQCCLC